MTGTTQTETKDWAANARSLVVIWGLPLIAVIAGAFLEPMMRTTIWSIALLWMGGACLMNARRCGRVHCRYTGPFYLALVGDGDPLGPIFRLTILKFPEPCSPKLYFGQALTFHLLEPLPLIDRI